MHSLEIIRIDNSLDKRNKNKEEENSSNMFQILDLDLVFEEEKQNVEEVKITRVVDVVRLGIVVPTFLPKLI